MTNNQVAQQINPALDLEKFFPAATAEQWRAEAEAQLKGAPWEKVLQTRTFEGITLEPIYHPQSVGCNLGGGREPWTILQPVAAADPGQLSVALNKALNSGQNGVILEVDGSVVCTAADLRCALEGVHLDAVPVYLRTATNGPVVAAALLELIKSAGISSSAVRGGLLFDPVGASALKGAIPSNFDAILASLGAIAGWLRKHSSTWRPLSVGAAGYADGGAHAVDELAIALATGAFYMRKLGESGLSSTPAANAISVELGLGSNFYMEVAKIRAFKILWHGMVGAFGADDSSAAPHIIGRSLRLNKSSLDAPTNILRSTAEALAGALGGCAAIQLLPFEGCCTPTERAARLARNTHIILQKECPLLEVEDPAAGSWFIESLTDSLRERAWNRFQEIEAEGGILAALRNGTIQQSIAAVAEERKKQVAQRRAVLVGVNRFADISEEPSAPAIDGGCQCAGAPAAAKLPASILSDFLVGEKLPADASFGSISIALGLYPDVGESIRQIERLRLAEPYEKLRVAIAARPKERRTIHILHGKQPKEHMARAEFTVEYFAAGGFHPAEYISEDPAVSPLGNLPVNEASVVVLCADDATYQDWVPAACKALKAANPAVTIVLAGDPGKNGDAYTAAGLDTSFSIRSNHLQIMQQCLEYLGKAAGGNNAGSEQ